MKTFVEDVLLKPYKYNLIRGNRDLLDRPTDNNLAFLATIITQLYRLVFRDQQQRIMVCHILELVMKFYNLDHMQKIMQGFIQSLKNHGAKTFLKIYFHIYMYMYMHLYAVSHLIFS